MTWKTTLGSNPTPNLSLGWALLIAGAWLPACGADAPASLPDAGAGTTALHTFQYATPPGQETHWCQYLRLPRTDAAEQMLTGYRWSWSGLHHWSLYRTVADLPVSDLDFDHPFDCFQPGAMKYAAPASILIIGAQSGERTFPPGMGFALHSEEVVLVQAHTINASTTVQNPTLEVGLELAAPDQVSTRLGLIQFYDPYIVVPALTDARAQMRCRFPSDLTILGATTHQHVRGTGVSVYLDGPDGQPAATPAVQSWSWDHPTVLESELQVQAGSHARTICSYRGDDRALVVQGQDKLDDEMCMFIGFYYPAIAPEDGGAGFENCLQTPLPGGVGDGFGGGAKSCADTLACVRSCPPTDAPRPGEGRIDVGACWQSCVVDSCAGASAPLDALLYCVRQQCAA
ncbi:MAG TPA: hypothetical protein VGP78_00160, partial [Solirubrobacteraceae bacterium]|nr:hypothetical protein [Solirubrobacteraceae bacterium]